MVVKKIVKELVLVGGGGHCRACIDVIEQSGLYTITGIVDVPEKLGQKVGSYKFIGTDADLPKLVKKYRNCLITVGQIKEADIRVRLFQQLKELGAHLPVIISRLAYVANDTKIAEGTIVMHHALINAGAKIGGNCIINTKALIEHDVVIEDHVHVATAAVVNGGCRIGEGALIGSSSVLIPGVNIAQRSIVGAGAVVVETVDRAGTFVGNPARRIK